MPWYEKDYQTPFETTSINGLAFLHGDVVARHYKQEWVRGKKYPLITYPSGTTREVIPSEESANIVLFGDLALPSGVTLTEATRIFATQPHLIRVRLQTFEERSFVVFNRQSRRGYRLIFDQESGILSNMLPAPEYAMELLPGELRAVLPKLYSTEKQGTEAIAPIKFFTPDSSWSWYPTEFDGDDLFFGLVRGLEVEIGYFSLSELESVRGGLGLPIERDL